jgi:hypothetical protein
VPAPGTADAPRRAAYLRELALEHAQARDAIASLPLARPVRAALGEDAFDVAWTEGRMLGFAASLEATRSTLR